MKFFYEAFLELFNGAYSTELVIELFNGVYSTELVIELFNGVSYSSVEHLIVFFYCASYKILLRSIL